MLGGAGGIGSVAARALACVDDFDQIVVADQQLEAARRVASELGDTRASAAPLEAGSADSVRAAVAGASVVVNCVGPFYRFGPPVLAAVIEAGTDYVDVCDDLDATLAMLELDGAARQAGVSALIGMGNSPGLANVLVRYCADELLDRVEAVDIMHVHGGEPEEGDAVVKHRIHAMTNDVPLFVGGEHVSVRMLERSGRAFVKETRFRDVGTLPVYPYPHPETITLPRHIAGLRRATNLGVVVPLSYFELTMDMVRLGLCAEEPVTVRGREVVPLEFAVAHILSRRPALLEQAGVTGPRGCLKVEVAGERDGEPHAYVFSLSSSERGAGEGTGIPAALGAIMRHRGQITEQGVFPPEAGVSPAAMLALAGEVVKRFGMGGGLPIQVEHVDGAGRSETMDLAL